MSHPVITTFDTDETKVQENAEKEAGRQIANQVIGAAFGNSYSRESLMKKYVEAILREMLEPHKKEIIDEAVKAVTENLHRTKAVKEKLAETGR